MHRSSWAGVVGAVARSVRDLDLAEDCAQEAFAAAADRWPVDGVPTSPEGWLVTVARRRAVEQLRRRQSLRRRLPLLLLDEADGAAQVAQEQAEERVDRAREGSDDVDFVSDRLRLLFTCCHPALAPESQVALTARLVCGLTTQEAATVLLVGEATTAARITRAKRKIASAGIPFRVPTGAQLPERLDVVLTVVHVLATAGHMAPAGATVVREDLLARALELSGSLLRVMPDEAEVLGLHALVLLCWARRHGRQDEHGRLLLLQEQDRSTWDAAAVAEADRLVRQALRRAPPGRMALQAAVAACHATAPTYASTDWRQVVGLYDRLLRVWPSPAAELARAVATTMADGPEAGLGALDRIAAPPPGPYAPAARAHVLEQLGRRPEAREQYVLALSATANEEERRLLRARLDALG